MLLSSKTITLYHISKMCRCMSSVPRALAPKKSKSDKTASTKHFVDFKLVTVQGGNGGNGALTFTSLPRKEFAGPDGGDGGNGGHVIMHVDENMKSLSHVPSIIRAEDGVRGSSKCCHGKCGEHTHMKVPMGTMVYDDDRSLLADLDRIDSVYVAARGGAGGHGNHFYLSNENRAPMIAEQGAAGEIRKLALELRTLAHVGLIGFPNAGKSTLLRAISRAKPKVASYPFTTLKPHVGIVEYEDYEQVAVADIPGIIKDAHLNRGLGFAFLRHIERCVCLLYVIDLSVDNAWTQLEDLRFELEQYEKGLSERPHAIVCNKTDLPEARDNLKQFKNMINLPIFEISAKNRINIGSLLTHVRELYDNNLSSSKTLSDSDE